MERTVLITNLLDVVIDTSIGKITTHTNALVLFDRGSDDRYGPSGPRYRAYGYRNEASNPTFDLMLPSFDWSIEPQSYRRAFTLCVAAQPHMTLMTDFANDLPLDIERLEGEDARRGLTDLLMRKVLRYYHAPYFVIGQQVETELARKALGVEEVVEV